MKNVLLWFAAVVVVCAALQGGWMLYSHTPALCPVFYLLWFLTLFGVLLLVAAGTLAIAVFSFMYLVNAHTHDLFGGDLMGCGVMGFVAWAFSWMFMLQVNVLGQPIHATAADVHGMRALVVGGWLVLWALCGLKAAACAWWRKTRPRRAQGAMVRQLQAICKNKRLTPEQRQQALNKLFSDHLRLNK